MYRDPLSDGGMALRVIAGMPPHKEGIYLSGVKAPYRYCSAAGRPEVECHNFPVHGIRGYLPTAFSRCDIDLLTWPFKPCPLVPLAPSGEHGQHKGDEDKQAHYPRCEEFMPGVCNKRIPTVQPVTATQADSCFLHHDVAEEV